MTHPLNQEKLDHPAPADNLKNNTHKSHKELKDAIISRVGADLEEIETALNDNLKAHLGLVTDIAGHLLFSGGKRLRPLLMILSSRVCNYSGKLAVKFSTIFEYLHAATLLHDDVVDEAHMRRGKKAAHACWSVPKVVLTGDFLLARSLSIAAETGIPSLISVMAGITEDMSQGEIDQMEQKGRVDLTEAEYFRIIGRKTAVLIQGACRSGAIIAGAGDKAEEAMDRYGYHLGIAFQMADDLLDYTGDAASLGKKPGADIREGKLTLPLIHALSSATAEDRALMAEIIRRSASEDSGDEVGGAGDQRLPGDTGISGTEAEEEKSEGFATILEKLQFYRSIEYTEDRAMHHVSEAKKALDIFDDCEAKELMMLLADYSISRKV